MPEPGALIKGKRIAVVGAGIGGLAFSIGLLRACRELDITPPDVQLYEREASPEARSGQGYSLSIRSDSATRYFGMRKQVLQHLGVLDALLPFQEPGQAFHLATAGFKTLCQLQAPKVPGLAVGGLRISRAKLRQVLLGRVPSRIVHFGMTCSAARAPKIEGEPVELLFQDGACVRCDVLVIADGANSKLCAALRPEAQLRYCGVVMIGGVTDELQSMPPELLAGHWMAVAPNGTSLFVATKDSRCVVWSLGFRAPEGHAAELSAVFKDQSRTQDYMDTSVRALSENFKGPWPTILQHTPPGSLKASNARDRLPFRNEGPVIFIGDSCHAMPPFAGNGANMALGDARQLVEQLCSSEHTSLAGTIAAYDAESAPRSTAALTMGRRIIAGCHTQGWHFALTVALMLLMGTVVRVAVALSRLKARLLRHCCSKELCTGNNN